VGVATRSIINVRGDDLKGKMVWVTFEPSIAYSKKMERFIETSEGKYKNLAAINLPDIFSVSGKLSRAAYRR
jgi:hypothetical protein